MKRRRKRKEAEVIIPKEKDIEDYEKEHAEYMRDFLALKKF